MSEITKGPAMDVEVNTSATVGGIGAALLGIIGGAWRLVFGRIDKLEKRTDDSFRDVWSSMQTDREAASKFRVQIAQSVAALPTREEHDRRFERLENLIRGGAHSRRATD